MENTAKTNIVTYELEAGIFEWEIAPGKTIEAWGFNNQVPGPTLKAQKGDTLVIKVKNNLQEPTIIHWHGLRLPAAMDGTGEVQKPIAPGQEFEYRFVVPDAGTFWYHSHANETVQVERGMYGALIVEDKTDPVVDADRVFLIDDMKLTADFKFKKPGWYIPRVVERHDGREGDTLLVNGKEQPLLYMHAGQTERWRFINAASARYFLLHLSGRPFQIIGTDGGLLEEPRTVTQVLIVPGERMDIVAGPFSEGESFFIESLAYDRKTFVKSKRERFATVLVKSPKPSQAFIPQTLRRIRLLAPQDAPATRKVALSVVPAFKNGVDFFVNGEEHTTDQPVIVGDLQVWEVQNLSAMDHPFHLHGFFFQVLEENGTAPEFRAWKDTYNLGPNATVKIAWLPDNRPGRWMYHCHILEHHEAGMMAGFEVIDGSKPYVATKPVHACHASR